MSPVRTAWHTGLEQLDEPQRIEDVGAPIVLSADGRQAQLRAELLASVQQEARLDEAGVNCAIKDTNGASCHICPLYDPDDLLCRLGRLQERLITELRVASLGGRRL